MREFLFKPHQQPQLRVSILSLRRLGFSLIMTTPSKSSPSSSTRSRRSEFNSRVTIYESISTAQASTSTSIASTSTGNAKASTSKRIRSITPEIEEDLEEEEEYKPQLTNSRKKSKSPIKKSVKIEDELKEENIGEGGEDVKPKKSPSPRKPKPFVNSLAKPHPEPAKWKIQYEMIKEARKSIVAAVDVMGCIQGGREAGEEAPSEKVSK